jgi:hypothetical protein
MVAPPACFKVRAKPKCHQSARRSATLTRLPTTVPSGVVGRIARMERISARIGRLEEHGAYVQAPALKHKAKRAFVRLLNDRASWPRI